MLFRIFKMIASSGFLTTLECTKFLPRAPLGELTALLQPPSWFKGDLLLRGRGKEGRGGRGRKERGRKGEGKGREEEGTPPNANSWIRPCNTIVLL